MAHRGEKKKERKEIEGTRDGFIYPSSPTPERKKVKYVEFKSKSYAFWQEGASRFEGVY